MMDSQGPQTPLASPACAGAGRAVAVGAAPRQVDGGFPRPVRATPADAPADAAARADAHAGGDDAEDRTGRLKQASDAVALIHKTHFGRGPRRCRTLMVAGDTVLSIVEGTLNVAERRLVELGEYERVRSARLFAIDASQDDLRQVVGAAFQRDVRLLVAGVDPHRDVTTLTFVLA